MTKMLKFLSVAAMLILSVGVARADSGGDGHAKLGASGPGSPNCSSFQAQADQNGNINSDCTVTGQTATSIFFAVQNSQTSNNPKTLGLSCSAPQLTAIGWTQNPTQQVMINGALVDECSFSAPTASQVTIQDIANSILESVLTPTGNGNCNCNWNDFITGIPVGCDITITTQGNAQNQNFASNATYDVAPSQGQLIPFPEPGTILLLMIGLGAIVLYQKRQAKRVTIS
jgi:hypothetical protein